MGSVTIKLRLYLPAVAAVAALLAASASPAEETGKRNDRLVNIQPNRWLTLRELKPGQKGYFRRQGHGGSCFDTKRGRLVLFGSDTHGKSWLNAPRIFDPVTCQWSLPYPDDPRSTYTVNAEGLPVAGPKADHPWTTHTFGGVVYDPGRDEMVIVCHPAHMVPGRFTNAVKDLWPKITRHPTWAYSMAGGTWRALPGKAVSFFPNAAAWDSDRKAIIGYRATGIYELAGRPRAWKQLAKRGLFGYHNNCVYDSKHQALVVFGTNTNSNDVVVYRPATGEHRKMPTPGLRPPADQHNPMAFEPVIGRTVVIVDRAVAPAGAAKAKHQAEVWLYDLGADAWRQVPSATLACPELVEGPFGCGMNYNMEYDPRHKVLLLVTGGYGQPTTVRALRVDLTKLPPKPATPAARPQVTPSPGGMESSSMSRRVCSSAAHAAVCPGDR